MWQGVAKLVPLRKLLPTPSISVLKGVKHKVKQSNERKERGGGSLFMVAKSSEQPGVHVDKDLDSSLLEASSTLQSYFYSTTQSSLNNLSALLCLIHQSVMEIISADMATADLATFMQEHCMSCLSGTQLNT